MQRLVGDADAVVRLVAVAQALEDLFGLLDVGLVDLDLLEAALEGGVAFEVLAVLVHGRRADRLQLAARQRRLEDRGGVDGAFGGAGADEVVELVDEQDDVAGLADLLHDLLETLFELAAVLGAGDQRRKVEREDALALEQLGHLVAGDALREALDDGRLADAGLTDEHGVVLGAPREDLHDALDLDLAADAGVELALFGELGQVAAELVEHLGRLLALARRAAAAARGARERAHDLVADLVGLGVEVEQDARRDAFVFADQAQQDVLGADVVVTQRERLAQRQLEHLLGARRERDLAGGDLVALADDAHDGGADLFGRDLERVEHARGDALFLAQEAEQQVLGADVVVLQRPRLFLREDDDLAGTFGEAFEHLRILLRGSNLWYPIHGFARPGARLSPRAAPQGPPMSPLCTPEPQHRGSASLPGPGPGRRDLELPGSTTRPSGPPDAARRRSTTAPAVSEHSSTRRPARPRTVRKPSSLRDRSAAPVVTRQ